MAHGGQYNNANRFQPFTPPPFGSTVVQSDLSFMEDNNSPFFLHSGNHLSLVFVLRFLTGPNYNTWSWAMMMALNAKNKLKFVDDTFSQPMADDPTV